MFTAASPLFGPEGPNGIVVTDSIPLPADLPEAAASRITVVGIAGFLGDIIGRMHRDEAVSDLIPYD